MLFLNEVFRLLEKHGKHIFHLVGKDHAHVGFGAPEAKLCLHDL